MVLQDSRIYVAGHSGLVGSALMRQLAARGYHRIITRSHRELDLTDQSAVRDFFSCEKPEVVILAAAKVGGIGANATYPADFSYVNLAIQTNVIHAAWENRVARLIFLGSSCIYPKECPQPIKEEYLLTGPLETTNRPYALAKIAGIELCHAHNRQYDTKFLAAMPTNLYGPGDNFDLADSHVLPALIRKMHEAKQSRASEVVLWGSGKPKREFLFVDDLADALVFLATLEEARFDKLVDPSNWPMINIGTGRDQAIRDLADTIAQIVGYCGGFVQDTSKPDGTMRKVLDVSRMRDLGWVARTSLSEGIACTYDSYLRTLT